MKENFTYGLMKAALPMEVIYYFRWQALLYAANDMTKKKRSGLTNNSTPKLRRWPTRETLGFGLLIAIVIIFLYGATKKTIENIRLANHGKLTKGIVLAKKKVGGSGTIDFKVRYVVEEEQFETTTTNEPWDISDSVDILYLPSDPSIMRSYRFIKENYSTGIELK
jgi:hypothetical protein